MPHDLKRTRNRKMITHFFICMSTDAKDERELLCVAYTNKNIYWAVFYLFMMGGVFFKKKEKGKMVHCTICWSKRYHVRLLYVLKKMCTIIDLDLFFLQEPKENWHLREALLLSSQCFINLSFLLICRVENLFFFFDVRVSWLKNACIKL